jgi:hypothetical protein
MLTAMSMKKIMISVSYVLCYKPLQVLKPDKTWIGRCPVKKSYR